MKHRRIVLGLIVLLGMADATIGVALWAAWHERHPDRSARASEHPTPARTR